MNLLAWTDTDGVLTRWADAIPPDAVSPTKPVTAAAATTLPAAHKRQATPTLFDELADEDLDRATQRDADIDMDVFGDDLAADDVDLDAGIDDWVVDDLGGGLEDDADKKWSGRDGVREMGG